uniref:Terminase small subunit n=1 Tax=Pseudomonas phage Cygsa01 TaxID=3138529 RepID=A0AAU6W3V9_9VIRU
MLNPVKISCPAINRLQNTAAAVAVHTNAMKPLFDKLVDDLVMGRPLDTAPLYQEFEKLRRHVGFLQENATALEGVRTVNFQLRNWGEQNAQALKLANLKLFELGLPTFKAEEVELPDPVAPAVAV